ncbi:MAG: cytochrome c biogenesis protein CcdA [Actinobacteria bacterium]|nr:cytochrome c biogenesis protein CcdA [Actinomycetota bacterium]
MADVGQTVMSGSMLLAIPIAIAAGFLSFASPCVLPLVPGYLSFISGLSHKEIQNSEGLTQQKSRLVMGSLGFIAGFSFLFISAGAAFGQVGSWLKANQDGLNIVLGLVVIVMGASFLGWIPAAQQDFRLRMRIQDGIWSAPLLGLVFGLGWAPCIGPTLAAVLTLSFEEGPIRGAILAMFYCIGLGAPFLLVALAYRKSLVATKFLRTHSRSITKIGGAFLVLIGFAIMTGLWQQMTIFLQQWAANFGVFL